MPEERDWVEEAEDAWLRRLHPNMRRLQPLKPPESRLRLESIQPLAGGKTVNAALRREAEQAWNDKGALRLRLWCSKQRRECRRGGNPLGFVYETAINGLLFASGITRSWMLERRRAAQPSGTGTGTFPAFLELLEYTPYWARQPRSVYVECPHHKQVVEVDRAQLLSRIREARNVRSVLGMAVDPHSAVQ
jgi:hypothetical protein